MTGLPSAVLFACTMNSVRSPMAEALLKHIHGKRVFVDSAGVKTKEVDPFAVEVLKEIGIDLSRHQGKTFDDLDDDSFDVIISLSPEAQHRAVEITRTIACDIEYWPTFDPTIAIDGNRESRLNAYRELRDHLKAKILQRFPPDAPKSTNVTP